MLFLFFFFVLDVSGLSIFRGRHRDVCDGVSCTSVRPVCATRFRSGDTTLRCMSVSFIYHQIGQFITLKEDAVWDPTYTSYVFNGYRWDKFSGVLRGAGMLFIVEMENRQEYWLVKFQGLYNVPTTPPSTTTTFSTSVSTSSSPSSSSSPWSSSSSFSSTTTFSSTWVANSTFSVAPTRNNSTIRVTTANYLKPTSMSVIDISLWCFSSVAYLILLIISIILCIRRSRRIGPPIVARYVPDEAVHLNMNFIDIPL